MYEVRNPSTGEVLQDFPPQCQSAAVIYSIGLFEPELYQAANRLIRTNPQLRHIVWRGAEIVANGGVRNFWLTQGDALATVNSSDGNGRYLIEKSDNTLTCQCKHYTSFAAPLNNHGDFVCKHIAAYILHTLTHELVLVSS